MPFEIELKDRLLYLIYSGHVTRADLMASAREIIQLEERLERRPDQLTDLSGIERRDTDFQSLMPITSERQQKVFANDFRIAMVAPTTLSYGVARMFQTMASNPQIDIQIFPSRVMAEIWLASPSTRVRPT